MFSKRIEKISVSQCFSDFIKKFGENLREIYIFKQFKFYFRFIKREL